MDWGTVGELGAQGVMLALLVWLVTKRMPQMEHEHQAAQKTQREAYQSELAAERVDREALRIAYREEMAREREAHTAETSGIVQAQREMVEAQRETTAVLRGMNGRWDGKTERRAR